jgi:hypothetical protein
MGFLGSSAVPHDHKGDTGRQITVRRHDHGIKHDHNDEMDNHGVREREVRREHQRNQLYDWLLVQIVKSKSIFLGCRV